MLVFGSLPNSLRQPQNSFVSVRNSQWTSSPITASKARVSAALASASAAPASASAAPASASAAPAKAVVVTSSPRDRAVRPPAQRLPRPGT